MRPSLMTFRLNVQRGFVALALSCVFIVWAPSTQAIIGNDSERNIEKLAVKRVQPSYPSNAQKYKISGAVVIQVTIKPNGEVLTAEFIRGNNVFRSVALDAAKRWKFKIPSSELSQGTIRFTFKLSE